MKTKTNKIKKSWDDKLYMTIVLVCIWALVILCIVPFIYLFAVSFSDSTSVLRGEVFLIPKNFTISVYKSIIEDGTLLRSMVRSIILTLVFVIVSMSCTICCAYPLSITGFRGKKYFTIFIIITMYFSAGMIPNYLLINDLGLIDSYWALILPGCINTYNMIVMRSFFVNIPVSLKEAAIIDGAGDLKVLFKIVLPLSKSVLATVSLFYCVSRWNGMQDALMFINDPNKTVLQIRLKQMIQNVDMINQFMLEGASMEAVNAPTIQSIRAGALLIAMIPIIIIYPFMQKYLVKGTMIGAVKG